MSAPIKFAPVAEQLEYLRKGSAEIIREEELREKLDQSAKSGKPLRVYLGVDPTAPDLHLGHTVVLRKLKHFQDMGHAAIFLIGDFSAMIGDPTGQSETRPPLTREQVDANAKTYLEQVYKILDPKKTEVRYNSEWLGKMSSFDVVRLCGKYRLARMLEREDFRSRLANNQPISVHELLYPLLTALDAVELKSDIELGATEQKFNILVHRDIQREYGVSPEVVFTMPILVGLDGERKMSKSLGNYVGITETPDQMFGKLMSISDEMMWSYMELLTDRPPAAIVELRTQVTTGVVHPKATKIALAQEIIAGFHGKDAAERAAEVFDQTFRARKFPDDAPEIMIQAVNPIFATVTLTDGPEVRNMPQCNLVSSGRQKWSKCLATWTSVKSRSAIERLIAQRAVVINDIVLDDPGSELNLRVPANYQVRIGSKTFLRIVVRSSNDPVA